MAIKICSPLSLQKASKYANSKDKGAYLPEVFGDVSDAGYGQKRGVVPAVHIGSGPTGEMYMAANHQILAIDRVFVGETQQQVSGYATSVSNNYGGLGTIATINFFKDPGGAVSWLGRGMSKPGGGLMSNPIDQLQWLLLNRGGFAGADLDLGSFVEAVAAWDALNFGTAWVVNDPRTIQEWTTEILFNAMGFWRITGAGKLVVIVDTGTASPPGVVLDTIVAHRDCVDGDDGVELSLDRQHLVNKLTINFGQSYAGGGMVGQITNPADALSVASMGESRKEITLNGVRDEFQLPSWYAALFARQSLRTRVEGAQVRFSVDGPQLLHAAIGDLLPFTWRYGPTRANGAAYANELLRLVRVEHDLTQGGKTTVVGVDTGLVGGVVN